MKLRRVTCGCPAWYLIWNVMPGLVWKGHRFGFAWSGSIQLGFHHEQIGRHEHQ